MSMITLLYPSMFLSFLTIMCLFFSDLNATKKGQFPQSRAEKRESDAQHNAKKRGQKLIKQWSRKHPEYTGPIAAGYHNGTIKVGIPAKARKDIQYPMAIAPESASIIKK